MSHEAFESPLPQHREFVEKAATRVARIATERNEFAALGVWNRIRSMYIPQMVLQRAIHAQGQQAGLSLQTYRVHEIQPESGMSPIGQLMVRVVERNGQPVLPVLAEHEPVGRRAFVQDVFPPVE